MIQKNQIRQKVICKEKKQIINQLIRCLIHQVSNILNKIIFFKNKSKKQCHVQFLINLKIKIFSTKRMESKLLNMLKIKNNLIILKNK